MNETITIIWNKGNYAKFRTLQIYADDIFVGEIKQSESKDFIIPKSAKYIFGKMDWGKTESFPIKTFQKGKRLEIITEGSWNPLRSLGITTLPLKIREII